MHIKFMIAELFLVLNQHAIVIGCAVATAEAMLKYWFVPLKS